MKAEVKENLSKTLVTRDVFEENTLLTRKLFEEEIRHTRDLLEEKIQTTREVLEERFVRMELWFKVLVGVSLFGFTIANPSFIEIVKNFLLR